MSTIGQSRIGDLIVQLEELHKGEPWIGQSLGKLLDGLSEHRFFRASQIDGQSVARLLSHMTAWRQDALLKIDKGIGEKKDGDPEIWPEQSILRRKGRKAIEREYKRSLDDLLDRLKCKDDSWLGTSYFDQDFNRKAEYLWLIQGLIQHDVYHLGQMTRILKERDEL